MKIQRIIILLVVLLTMACKDTEVKTYESNNFPNHTEIEFKKNSTINDWLAGPKVEYGDFDIQFLVKNDYSDRYLLCIHSIAWDREVSHIMISSGVITPTFSFTNVEISGWGVGISTGKPGSFIGKKVTETTTNHMYSLFYLKTNDMLDGVDDGLVFLIEGDINKSERIPAEYIKSTLTTKNLNLHY